LDIKSPPGGIGMRVILYAGKGGVLSRLRKPKKPTPEREPSRGSER
jgi:hypothetical protein